MVAHPTVRAHRRDLARLLIDTVTIKRESGTVFDPNTGQNTVTYTTLYSAVPARIKPMSGTEVTAGEQSLAVHAYEITVEWDTDDVRPEDIVEVVTSLDGDLSAANLIVEDTHAWSFAGHRKLICRLNLE